MGWGNTQQRAFVTGTASAGENISATDLLEGNFIDILRNRTIFGEIGARYLLD